MKALEVLKGLLGQEEQKCACSWRERFAEAKDSRIGFAADLSSFYLDYGTKEHPQILFFLYCPSCGKRVAPPQPWEAEFPHQEITGAERRRLEQLTRGLDTRDNVIAKFGRPDSEMAGLVYYHLSQTADVWFQPGADERLKVSLMPKLMPGELERLYLAAREGAGKK